MLIENRLFKNDYKKCKRMYTLMNRQNAEREEEMATMLVQSFVRGFRIRLRQAQAVRNDGIIGY
jgi:hypothetical protein